jgi:hypothetical protein
LVACQQCEVAAEWSPSEETQSKVEEALQAVPHDTAGSFVCLHEQHGAFKLVRAAKASQVASHVAVHVAGFFQTELAKFVENDAHLENIVFKMPKDDSKLAKVNRIFTESANMKLLLDGHVRLIPENASNPWKISYLLASFDITGTTLKELTVTFNDVADDGTAKRDSFRLIVVPYEQQSVVSNAISPGWLVRTLKNPDDIPTMRPVRHEVVVPAGGILAADVSVKVVSAT